MKFTDWSSMKTNEGFSSDEDPYDSDIIGSDVEAELYSVIHHETSVIEPRESCSSVNYPDQKETSVINSSQEEACLNSDSEISVTHFNYITLNSSKVINNLENDRKQISNNFHSDFAFDCELYKSFDSPTSKIHQVGDPKSGSCLKKRKPDLYETFQTVPKKQKTLSNRNLSNCTEIVSKYNDSIVLDSSDDDIIWMDSTETNSFQTNLSQNNSLDLDSESNDSWCFKMANDTSLTRKNLEDPWFINKEDFYRSRKSVGRYHESKFLTCNNCNQKGHTARFCSTTEVKKCYICGMQHKPSSCKRRICIKCHRIGHDMKYCGYAVLRCCYCRMIGHSDEKCPDLWRKYQLTTANKFIKAERLRQNTPLYCYNCGQKGHFGGECQESRMRTTVFHTWPMVLDCIPPQNIHYSTLNRTATEASTSNQQTDIEGKELSFMDKFIAKKKLPTKRKKKNKKKDVKVSSNTENTRDAQQSGFQRTPKKQQSRNCDTGSIFPQIGTVIGSKKMSKKEKHQAKKMLRRKLKKFKWISNRKNRLSS